jgi:hypothetical protein
MTNDIASVAFLKEQLQARGTAKVVRLAFLDSSAYYKEDFVHACLDEIQQVILRKMLGEEATPLEMLAMQVLLESAYFKSFAEVEHAIEMAKLRTQQNEKL